MEVSGKTLGALVLSLPVDELQTALETVKRQLMTVFLIVAGAAMAAALMLSGMLTRPVKALTQTIRRMGKGDLSARVNDAHRRIAGNWRKATMRWWSRLSTSTRAAVSSSPTPRMN